MSATDSGIVSVGETVVTEEKGVKIPLSSQMDPGLETAEDEAVLCPLLIVGSYLCRPLIVG